MSGAAGQAVDGAAERMGRHMDAHDLRDLLAENLEHPRWDDVADRCLTCGNCVLVCPTCFCTTVEDHTDLAGEHAERWRTWDTCFSRRPLLHPRRQRSPKQPLAIPAMDDAQARHVARPVRYLRLRRLRALHHVVPRRHRHHRGGGRDPRYRREETDGRGELDEILSDVPFLEGMGPERLALLAGCASNVALRRPAR